MRIHDLVDGASAGARLGVEVVGGGIGGGVVVVRRCVGRAIVDLSVRGLMQTTEFKVGWGLKARRATEWWNGVGAMALTGMVVGVTILT